MSEGKILRHIYRGGNQRTNNLTKERTNNLTKGGFMDHELEQWIDDTKDSKWPCGKDAGISLAGVVIGNWAKPDKELRHRIFGSKTPKGLKDLQEYINNNFHS
jgi:hypothetical protein